MQVSSSCTSVYVDGSETRGALNAEVKIKYGTFSGEPFQTPKQFNCGLTTILFMFIAFENMTNCNIIISGQAYFTVWMAEMPLDLVIPDDNLSQIKSWKIPGSIEK